MKTFIGIFAVCLVVGFTFLFFGGAMLLENIWAAFVLCMLVLAALLTALVRQETKIGELEARLKQLETERQQDV